MLIPVETLDASVNPKKSSVCSLTSTPNFYPDLGMELTTTPRAIKKKKGRKLRKRRADSPSYSRQRLWGIFSLTLGGYCIIFFALSAFLFVGVAFYWYLFALLLLGAILGVMLVMAGVSNIDQSYITYSENAALTIERLRPQMWRDFIFALIFLVTIIPLLLLKFYVTASLVLLLVAVLLIIALLKRGEIQRLGG